VEKARSKKMGIMAIKSVAKTRVAREEKPYPNMWYKPYEEEKQIENCLRFTLSKDITGTVHAGDSLFMKKTLKFVHGTKKITAPDQAEITALIDKVEPIFSHPGA
jgi:hypothetical protein